jgi:hypothetical protein
MVAGISIGAGWGLGSDPGQVVWNGTQGTIVQFEQN